MANILVAYATSEGQTGRVAERIADTIAAAGYEATTVNLSDTDAPVDLDAHDAVLVGASIHAGKHQSAVSEFAADHRETLAALPTGFFQVSLSSATDEGKEEAAGYVEAFVADTGWDPDRIGLFGGALRYSEMGFVKRTLIKSIAKRAIPGTDTSADAEFTDWDEVEAFATDFAAFVAERTAAEDASS